MSSRSSRRGFLGGLATTGAASLTGCPEAPSCVQPLSLGSGSLQPPEGVVPLPTACDYCIVGCAFLAYRWPADTSAAAPRMDRPWVAPEQRTLVQVGGRAHYVAVVPDPNAAFVNSGGDSSVRGATLAQKLPRAGAPSADRLQRPALRVNGQLLPISWDDALWLMAELSRHVIDTYKPAAWGLKMYSYQYYENTFALTKLALGQVRTTAFAVHDKPSDNDDVPGLTDAGVLPFNCSYADLSEAEVLFVSGVSLHDAKTVLFQEFVKGRGARLIVVNPRRDLTADYAVNNKGMHLAITPGTDTALHNALARYILEQGWVTEAALRARTVFDESPVPEQDSWRRKLFTTNFIGYRTAILNDPDATIAAAAQITGLSEAQIIEAARMLAAPIVDGGARAPRSSFLLEKGNYWGHNYENTASLVSLGLLCGAHGDPGRVLARAGGHQRGMIKGGDYPTMASPDSYQGNPIPLNLDRWVTQGHVRMQWVVGTHWFAAMGASSQLREVVRALIQEHGGILGAELYTAQGIDRSAVLTKLKSRMAQGGMILVQQDIYPNAVTELADLVLPAAAWGEEDFTRMQGERRLRLYSKIMDPPGEARPDWWIAAQVGERLYPGAFSWRSSAEVFAEALRKTKDESDCRALEPLAQQTGQSAHELLRQRGSQGYQCPLRWEGGAIIQTPRMHGAQGKFKTPSGKALYPVALYQRVRPVQAQLEPKGDELWVTNIRVNRLWQSMADDARIPWRSGPYPANFLEINSADAKARGVEHGDWVLVENDAVPTQGGATYRARFQAVALVTEAVRSGVTATYFHFRGDLKQAANNITSGAADAMTAKDPCKLAKGRISRIGPSPYRDAFYAQPGNGGQEPPLP